MLDILCVVLFGWLFIKAAGLAFRVAWGTTKLVASLLIAIALPVLGLCLVFTGGLLLLVPIVLVGIGFAMLKVCI